MISPADLRKAALAVAAERRADQRAGGKRRPARQAAAPSPGRSSARPIAAGRLHSERRARTRDTQLLQARSQRVRMQPQDAGCVARAVDAPAATIEDPKDVQAVVVVEAVGRRRTSGRLERACEAELRARREDQRAFDDVLQLADVTGQLYATKASIARQGTRVT
jgi:hypothetical protein